MTRDELIERFLRAEGWDNAVRVSVAGDASNRRYDRLTDRNGKSAILMDAPSERGEDVRPFIRIAKYLAAEGLSAPAIYAQDLEAGLLLIEDLGDDLYARILRDEPGMENDIYKAAIDALIALHRAPMIAAETYGTDLLTQAAALAFDWYLSSATAPNDAAREHFTQVFRHLCDRTQNTPKVMILRDYHAENLIWLPDRDGVARVGMLDFQDAMAGHPAYDLMSILQDARRDVSPQTEAAMLEYYLLKTGFDPARFKEDYAILGAQRNLRILGVFARLCLRNGKQHYVDLIPRVWNHIQTNLAHPALSDTKALLDETLPAPTSEILERLKAKCATRTQ